MDPLRVNIDAVSAQSQGLVRQEIGTRVFKAALAAESAASLQLIQMMGQSTGIGSVLDIHA